MKKILAILVAGAFAGSAFAVDASAPMDNNMGMKPKHEHNASAAKHSKKHHGRKHHKAEKKSASAAV